MAKFTKEQIEERIAQSHKKYKELQVERERIKKEEKEVIASIHKNELPTTFLAIDDGVITVVAEKAGRGEYNCGLAFCSPYDQFSGRTGKILAFKRLQEKEPGYFIKVKANKRETIYVSAFAEILIALANKSGVKIPTWLKNKNLDELIGAYCTGNKKYIW